MVMTGDLICLSGEVTTIEQLAQRKEAAQKMPNQSAQLSFDLHGVVDGETRNDGSTGTIDVQVDGLVAVLASCHSTAVDAVAASLPRNPSKASGCPTAENPWLPNSVNCAVPEVIAKLR